MIVEKVSKKKDRKGNVIETPYNFHACDICGHAAHGFVTDPVDGRQYEVCNDDGFKFVNRGFSTDSTFYPPQPSGKARCSVTETDGPSKKPRRCVLKTQHDGDHKYR